MRTIGPLMAEIMPLILTGSFVLTDLFRTSELDVVQDLWSLIGNETDFEMLVAGR